VLSRRVVNEGGAVESPRRKPSGTAAPLRFGRYSSLLLLLRIIRARIRMAGNPAVKPRVEFFPDN